jgi:hypothetical protein
MNIRQSWKTYVVAAIVLVVSYVAAWTLPISDILRSIVVLPGVGALFAVLYQILRDQAAHEKALELQDRQQLFNLGVASHMATVAFDKHVQFSEQYISRMQRGLTELFQTGPPGKSLELCSDLIEIRLSFRAWITEDIEAKVMPFEEALRKISVGKFALEQLPVGDMRTRRIDEMYNLFSDVLGLEREGHIDEKIAARKIMSHLQELLGVQQLSLLRRAVVHGAIEVLGRKLG